MERSAKHDERVMTIVAAALRMPAAERDSFLHIACQDDAELYRESEKVVEWEERMGNFLSKPLIDFIDLEDFDRPFQVGDLISERFEIMREVGHGGMGVVYEAFDRKRNQRIAIKSALPGFGRLLSPELEGALKVRHPNICLVNEIHTAPIASGEVDFLTMEFLNGETLSARLAAQKHLSSEEVLEIARQLCAGLAEAHRSGIIHRDLKAANVILTRGKDASMRAVITDFGLARDATLDCEDFGGTPRYIAPELWRGEKASKASDIYALGVILYELATGQPPYEGSSNNEALTSEPIAPSTRNSGLDVRWNKAILPCLAPSPAVRPDATQVLAVFDKRPIWKSPVLAMAVVAMVALVTGLYGPVRDLLKPADIRLAILPVQASTDLTEMGNGALQDVAERIQRSQRGRGTIVVIPFSEALSHNVHTPAEALGVLHATHALQVTLRRDGPDLMADESVIELATQTHLRDFSGRYSPANIGDMQSALTGNVSLALRLQEANADRISSVATAAYDRGLYFLRKDRYSFDSAIPLFEEAFRLDPHSPLPKAGLAESQIMKFRDTGETKWRDEAQRSLQAAETLGPDSVRVRLASGQLNHEAGRYEAALEDYRRVLELEPRNVDAFLRIANAYDQLNMPEKAIQSYRKAIDLGPGYYAPYNELGVFYYFHGKLPEAAEQFQNVVDRAPGLFEAYSNLGAAASELGCYADAEKALESCLKIKETPGALNSLGAVRAYQHRDAEAVEYYKKALAIKALSIGPHKMNYLLNLGDAYRRLGRLEEAKTAYREAMKLALSELAGNPRNGNMRAFVAYFAATLGDRERATSEISQALQQSPGNNYVIQRAFFTYLLLGQIDLALEALNGATADLVRELNRHPDVADFRQNARFRKIVQRIEQQSGDTKCQTTNRTKSK
jgi:serine/threonine protein kinase/tetratricopeptide (TPR) repeat protein